jgi:hypothetical protein
MPAALRRDPKGRPVSCMYFCVYFSIQCSRGERCCISIAGRFQKDIIACAKVAGSTDKAPAAPAFARFFAHPPPCLPQHRVRALPTASVTLDLADYD